MLTPNRPSTFKERLDTFPQHVIEKYGRMIVTIFADHGCIYSRNPDSPKEELRNQEEIKCLNCGTIICLDDCSIRKLELMCNSHAIDCLEDPSDSSLD